MNQSKEKTTLTQRAQWLLKLVVECYIRDGQPVGSKFLAEETGLGLSSATIRNVLAELEENGYLRSPHTSAGRIPTAQGYRFFVNYLLDAKPVLDERLRQVQQQLSPDLDVTGLAASASNLLAELTQLAGVVMLPKREQLIFRHIEFLLLAERKVLVILVLNTHEVQNQIIYTERNYSASELQQAANYLNATYIGLDMRQLREDLWASLQQERVCLDYLVGAALEMVNKAFAQFRNNADYILAGQNNLFELAKAVDIDRLRQLFEAFSQKEAILHLLDQCLGAEGIQIFIGEESGHELLDECSLVTAPYSVAGKFVGVLGVIGPTRMAYDLAIASVDRTAKLLSLALNPPKLSPY